jgi:hypothetical protein
MNILLALPYGVFLAISIDSVLFHRVNEPWIFALFLASFVGCLLGVPLISRRKLWLGFVAVLFPFVVFALVGVFSPSEIRISGDSGPSTAWTLAVKSDADSPALAKRKAQAAVNGTKPATTPVFAPSAP